MEEKDQNTKVPIWPLILIILTAIVFIGLQLYVILNNQYLFNNNEKLYSSLHSILRWCYLLVFVLGITSIVTYFVPSYDSTKFNKLKWFSSLSLFFTLFALFKLSTDYLSSSIVWTAISLNPTLFSTDFLSSIISYLAPAILALLLVVIFVIIARNNIKKRFIVSLIVISFSFLLTSIGYYPEFRISSQTITINGILLFYILSYIYFSSIFKRIAEKLNYEKPNLAFIPFANLFLLPILAKKNWKWGFLFFLIPIVLFFGIFILILFNPGTFSGFGGLGLLIIGLFLFYLLELIVIDYFMGKIFKLRNYPSWLSFIFSLSAHNYFLLILWLVLIFTLGDTFGSILVLSFKIFLIPYIASGIILGFVAWKDKK